MSALTILGCIFAVIGLIVSLNFIAQIIFDAWLFRVETKRQLAQMQKSLELVKERSDSAFSRVTTLEDCFIKSNLMKDLSE